VKVKAFGTLKELTRDRFELREHSSVLDYFAVVLKANPQLKKVIIDPDTNEVSPAVCAVLNGEGLDKLERKLADGDELTIFIGVSGG
jgi:molybdopterin converting factor small subunit